MSVKKRLVKRSIYYYENFTGSEFKSLNIKDSHFRLGFKAPKGRDEEEFEKDVFSKVDQICKICRDNKVHIITIAGDVFDIKEASRYTIVQLTLLHTILTKLRESTILKKIVTIAGNHDLPNSSRAMKEKSVYGYFKRIGILTDIHDTEIIFTNNKFNVSYYGLDYNNKLSELNKEMARYDSKIKPENTYRNILIHEHLLKKDDLKKREAKYLGNRFTYGWALNKYPSIDVFIAGHYHFGYPTYKSKEGKVIINNWNLIRLARNYYVLNGEHIPNVVITKFTTNGIDTEDLPLRVREYAKAINIEELQEESEDILNVQDFVDRINNSSVSDDIKSEITLTKRQTDMFNEILEEAKTEVQE